jgi:hypothetical protein
MRMLAKHPFRVNPLGKVGQQAGSEERLDERQRGEAKDRQQDRRKEHIQDEAVRKEKPVPHDGASDCTSRTAVQIRSYR